MNPNTKLPRLEARFLENCDRYLKPDLKKCLVEVWQRQYVIQLWIFYPNESFCFEDWNRWRDWVIREARKQNIHEVKFLRAQEAIDRLKSSEEWEKLCDQQWDRIEGLLNVVRFANRRSRGWR